MTICVHRRSQRDKPYLKSGLSGLRSYSLGPEEALPLQARGKIEQRREHLAHPIRPSAMICSMRAAAIVSWVCDIRPYFSTIGPTGMP
jgi:hypothetical protein